MSGPVGCRFQPSIALTFAVTFALLTAACASTALPPRTPTFYKCDEHLFEVASGTFHAGPDIAYWRGRIGPLSQDIPVGNTYDVTRREAGVDPFSQPTFSVYFGANVGRSTFLPHARLAVALQAGDQDANAWLRPDGWAHFNGREMQALLQGDGDIDILVYEKRGAVLRHGALPRETLAAVERRLREMSAQVEQRLREDHHLCEQEEEAITT